MRRADRLFRIVQFLRSRRLSTAQWLATQLEVSTRTIYRDIAELSRSGVPVEGEAGVGYVLRHKLDLPPLMFERRELVAIELGLRFVGAYAGRPLSAAAASAMAKVRTALPKGAAVGSTPSALYVPRKRSDARPSLAQIFAAIEGARKVRMQYSDAAAQETSRIVWPLGAFFWGGAWTVLAWCEWRKDFRSFRVDRIAGLKVLPERYPDSPGRRLADYFRWMEKTHAVPMSDFDPLA
jgi:predicted DNA-binding transcriptional regulator YafY